MHTQTGQTSTARWQRLVTTARTPQEHALLATSAKHVGPFDGRYAGEYETYYAILLTYYDQLAAQNAFAALNDTPASTGHAFDLSRIAQAGPDGLHAHMVNAGTRGALLRREWITVLTRDGRRAGPNDWAATLRLTWIGEVQLASAMMRPVTLTDAQGAMLSKIERAGAAGHLRRPRCPPRDLALCHLFDLSAVSERDVYTLTDTGHAALARWRQRARKALTPTRAQHALLSELIDGNTADRQYLYATGTYEACEAQQWIVWGQRTGDGRAPLFITAAGREAHARYAETPTAAKADRVAG